MKKTIYFITLLVTLALGVRLVIAFNTYVISSDGPFYLRVAKYFVQGDYKSALIKQTFHPLYPFLIAIAYKFIGVWEWAGMLASIILSSLGVIPLYFIARKYFAGPIAIIACLLYVFHPQGAQLSASIFTTGTHISVLLFALWVTVLALETNRSFYFILSGLLSFVMYLNRPDGLVFLAITLIGILSISVLSWKEKVMKVLCLIIPWLFMLVPYLIAVKSLIGIFGLTGKVSVETVTNIEITKSFSGLYQFMVEFIKGANPVLFILFIAGLALYFKKEQKPFKKSFFIWLVFTGFIAVFAIYAFTHGRMSKRYTVPLFLMMLPWTSCGIYYLGEKISSHYARKIIYGITILALLTLSLFTFKPVGKDKIIEKTTGELLNKYHSKHGDTSKTPSIITTSSRVAYYGGGEAVMPACPPFLPLAGREVGRLEELGEDYAKLADIILEQRIDYFVLDDRISRKIPSLENEIFRCKKNQLSVELISPYFEVADGKNVNFYKTYRFFIIQKNK